MAVTFQLYHQLSSGERPALYSHPLTYLTLVKGAKSPQWKLVPGGIHTPFLELWLLTAVTKRKTRNGENFIFSF